MARGPAGMGETLGEMVGERHEGMEGNGASAFPVHLGTWEPVGPLEPPSCHTEPKPRPYTPTQGPTSTLGDSLQCAGPTPHPYTLMQGPTLKLRNSTLQRLSFPRAASPLLHRS